MLHTLRYMLHASHAASVICYMRYTLQGREGPGTRGGAGPGAQPQSRETRIVEKCPWESKTGTSRASPHGNASGLVVLVGDVLHVLIAVASHLHHVPPRHENASGLVKHVGNVLRVLTAIALSPGSPMKDRHMQRKVKSQGCNRRAGCTRSAG